MPIELFSFFTIAFFIAITPGPSVIYVVSYSLRYGPKAGIASTLGINAGSVIAILIAAFGLTYLLEVYPNAIDMIQLVGAFYIIYLGSLMWPRQSSANISEQDLGMKSYRSLFKNGFITSVLNPKDILFYTAFIPTFIPDGVTGKSYKSYFLVLAFCYMLIGFVTKSMFALFSGYAKNVLHSKKASLINYFSSVMLIGLGAFLVGTSISGFFVYE